MIRVARFLLLLALAAPAFAGEPSVLSATQGGVTVELSYQALHDGNGLTRISLSDARSGLPIEGARPAAWMLRRHSEQVANELGCTFKAQTLMAGSLGSRADVDLNGYRLVTLNQDDTVAFINPHVGLRNSKLESIVQLPSRGYDWVWLAQAQRLFISLREIGKVALVDSLTRRLVGLVDTGEGSLPTRLVADPDGRKVWVGLDGGAELLALDASDGRVLERLAVGEGPHTLMVDAGARWLAATNADGNSVSLIERVGGRITTVEVPGTPVASAWSAAAQRLAVLAINAGTLSLIDPASGEVERIALQPGVEALGLFDDGRYALVLNGMSNRLSLIDLATARRVDELEIPGRPDHLGFSRDFAYVRSQESADMRLVNLGEARRGKLVTVNVPMGRGAPAELARSLNVASPMAPAPEGNGMLVGNPADAMIYRYVEGMMVPVGSFSNYRRPMRGLLVLDSSLVERRPGRFEAATQVERSGRYDVVIRNLQPSITSCFVLDLQGMPAAPQEHPSATPKLQAVRAATEDVAQVEFALHDAAGKALDTGDVTLLAVQWQGPWQGRTTAVPLGEGRYRAELHGLRGGRFELLVRAPALGTGYERGRLGTLRWPLEAPR
ncbi:hypothetical protein H681_06260 [Pseudomonas sp. ATCC 13867]|nr:hypothetical protein H681_06260 [Pseudomonas sp. ATCC 13867]